MADVLKRWIPLGQLMRQAAEKSGRAQMSQPAQQRPDLLRAIQQAQEAIGGSSQTLTSEISQGIDDGEVDSGNMPKRIQFFPSRDYETRNWAPETMSSDSLTDAQKREWSQIAQMYNFGR